VCSWLLTRRSAPRQRRRPGLTSLGARANPCLRSRELRDAAFKACVGLLLNSGAEGCAALAAAPAFISAACRMAGSRVADSRFFSLTALTRLMHECSTLPADKGCSLLAASLRAGDPEALAGGLAKAARDYVGSSLQASQSESMRVVKVLKLIVWLLAQPGAGDDAARAMPPGVALDLAALALGARKADPEDVSGGVGGCGLGRGKMQGAPCHSCAAGVRGEVLAPASRPFTACRVTLPPPGVPANAQIRTPAGLRRPPRPSG
jgi:hypothetical protein